MNTKNFLILFSWLFIVFVILMLYLLFDHNNRHANYIPITTDDEILGVVDNVELAKSTAFISIGENRYIISSSDNYEYTNERLVDHLTAGDSLRKQAGNDTITVFHKGSMYVFVHGESINRK